MELAGKFFPAFEQVDGIYVQTPETEKVLGIMQENTDIPINVQAAPSVLSSIDGGGMWGTGGGVHDPLTGGTYVDPIKGSVTVAAHEAAHQAFPSQLINDVKARAKGMESLNMDFPQKLIDDGTAMRVGYEALSKPIMFEEAHAQGVTAGALNKAGLPVDTLGFPDMLGYPAEYRFGGYYDKAAPLYKKVFNKPGAATLLPEEVAQFDTIQKSFLPAIKRQYQTGIGRIQ
jgi:hypothetical protein